MLHYEAPEFTPGFYYMRSFTYVTLRSTSVHPWHYGAPEFTPGITEHLSSPLDFSVVRAARCLDFCVVFCRLLFVLLLLSIVLSVLRFTAPH